MQELQMQQEKELEKAKAEQQRLQNKVTELERRLQLEKEQEAALRKEMEELRKNMHAALQQTHDITTSHVWRMTKPLRSIMDGTKRLIMLCWPLRFAIKGAKILLTQGPAELGRRVLQKYKGRIPTNYLKITSAVRRQEEAAVFPKAIKFSILVPLYNTPIEFLKEMIESVQAQTYKNWELCLVDGSDAEHTDVEECVGQYQKKDARIVYQKLEKNMGISENTNACIDMATGDYISLFDHDDILHPSALYETVKAINEEGADFLYTDEAVFLGTDITKIYTFHFKPDFAIDNLRANNYICHFTSFSRKLLEKSGTFRKQYDGSQDHDLILRLTHHAEKVYHIRKLLYFWRSHANSVAQNIGSKPYAIQAGVNSTHDNLVSFGLPCETESIAQSPTLYRVRYELTEKPLVSIIIPYRGQAAAIENCLRAIIARTSYASYEVVVVIQEDIDSELKSKFVQYKKEHKVRFVFQKNGKEMAAENFGAAHAKGSQLIFLDAQVEVTSPRWIEELLMYSQRSDVGAVSMMLYNPNQTIYHAGYILGIGKEGIVGISHQKMPREYLGYMGRMLHSQNVSAVSKACLMVKRELFEAVRGFDETYTTAYDDVDFCLKLRCKNKLNVFTPYAEGYFRKAEKKRESDKQQKEKRQADGRYYLQKWEGKAPIHEDPFYNPNFTKDIDYQIDYANINAERRG